MQNTKTELQPASASTAESPSLSEKFGDIGALLAQDRAVPVADGQPIDIDPNAAPVAPISMAELKPDAASTEARVAMEKQAAQAVLDAANEETLRVIASGGAANIAQHLQGNPALLKWMQTEAGRLIESNEQRAGGAVLYFEVKPLVPERAHIATERKPVAIERKPVAPGPRHAAGERRSFFEERSIYTGGRRYRPAHYAQ